MDFSVNEVSIGVGRVDYQNLFIIHFNSNTTLAKICHDTDKLGIVTSEWFCDGRSHMYGLKTAAFQMTVVNTIITVTIGNGYNVPQR